MQLPESAAEAEDILADAKRERRERALHTLYNISTETYEALLHAQHGRCAICGTPCHGMYLAVDHDHDTGKVRGLLCTTCNVGLGMFKDDTSLLTSAIEYLNGSR